MDRTIKFRIWNNKTKSWIHGPHKESSLDGVNLFGEMILMGYLLNGVSIQGLNEIVALQFTGLLDKNNKEIFEGDIIKFVKRGHTHGPEPEEVKAAEVWYSQEDAQFVFGKYPFPPTFSISPLGYWWYSTLDDLRDLEVIGNIFENPNLLTK